MFPGFDRIYHMEQEPLGDKCFYAALEDYPGHFELLRGEWRPDTALQAHWVMGAAEPEDIARGRGVSWFYLSPRVQELFRDNNLTGWSTYQIILHDKAGEVCPGYAGLSITGRCGSIDKQGGKVVPGQKPGKKFVRRIGLFFDESTWDGSDFFCPAGTNAYMFVTERVKNLFEENAIRGFEFTPLTEATWYP